MSVSHFLACFHTGFNARTVMQLQLIIEKLAVFCRYNAQAHVSLSRRLYPAMQLGLSLSGLLLHTCAHTGAICEDQRATQSSEGWVSNSEAWRV